MTVSFYGRIKDYTNGERNYTPCAPAAEKHSTLRAVLDELSVNYGESFNDFIQRSETCLFLVNGKGTVHTGGLDTPVKQGDKIEILPFVEAG